MNRQHVYLRGYDCVIKCDGHSKIHFLNLVSCPRHSKWSRQKCGLLKAFQAFRSVGYFTLSQANSLDKNFKEGRNWSFGPYKKPLNHTALVLHMPSGAGPVFPVSFFKTTNLQISGIFGEHSQGLNRLVGHFFPGKVSFTSSSNSLAHFWRPWPFAWCVPQMWVASKVQANDGNSSVAAWQRLRVWRAGKGGETEWNVHLTMIFTYNISIYYIYNYIFIHSFICLFVFKYIILQKWYIVVSKHLCYSVCWYVSECDEILSWQILVRLI